MTGPRPACNKPLPHPPILHPSLAQAHSKMPLWQFGRLQCSTAVLQTPLLIAQCSPLVRVLPPTDLSLFMSLPALCACCITTLLVCASILGCDCLNVMSASAAIAVNPSTGIDSPACGVTPVPPCRTIAYAVLNLGASFVDLSAGVFNEPAVSITSALSLVISGVPSATVFDCSSRPGPAFIIVDSTVNITGVTFQACSNPNATGGALSANRSSVAVMQCSFVNCSAASGGAMSVSGPGSGLYLSVQNSNFSGNSANGGLVSCPADAKKPCSTWGGAVAVFEILNVTVIGCRMVNNTAQASVPTSAPQYHNVSHFGALGGNAVAGGGCVSVVFAGSTSGCSVLVSDNSFLQCTVTLSNSNGVFVGNGTLSAWNAARAALRLTIDTRAGYGGGVSVYFGLSIGLQLLDVAFFKLALLRNDFTHCTVFVSAGGDTFYGGGSVYGGGVSVYMGGYSSSFIGSAADVGDTLVRNASVRVDTVAFTSCSVNSAVNGSGNAYGGSFSLYLGGYAWSLTKDGPISSKSGSTTASGVRVSISDVNSSNCSASTTGSPEGANAYGGSMSVVYIGAYARSRCDIYATSHSLSECGKTDVSDLVLSMSSSRFAHSSAVSRTFSQCPLVSISLT